MSVIIPVYNTETYIKTCLDSVLNQSLRPKEIILIDDGSTDSSSIICDQYSVNYEEIKVVHKKNAGLGMARNTGIENSNCEYVMFIDSDDFIKKDMIKILYEASENEKYDLIKSGFIRTDLNGVSLNNERRYEFNEVYNHTQIKEDLIPRMLGSLPSLHDSFEMGVTCSLLRRSIIINNHILFPSERELISEDLVFNLSFMPMIQNVKVLSYCGYMYRTNPNSLTVKLRENRFELTKNLSKLVESKILDLHLENQSDLRWKKTFFIYLWMCIKQEKGQKYNESKARLNKISVDDYVKKFISNYPVNSLGAKQRILIYLIKWRKIKMLWRLAQWI